MSYINTVQDLSIRKIEKQILDKFDVKISRETIRKYKNSLNEPKVVIDNSKIVKEIVRNSSSRSRRNGFDLSLNKLKVLLDNNPDHVLHDTLEHQFVGKTIVKGGKQVKSGGKLRANLMQLFSFLKDVD